MKANAVPLLAIFEKKVRLEVPLFQRQYVWSREQQWEPLWDDIERKFSEYLEGRKDAPVHFLGAMVLDQKQTPITHVEKRQVIDGQQRLTTLQIFLAAFRDYCRVMECEDLAKETDAFTFNRGMMAEPEVDKYKVWPTQSDRTQFTDVLSAGSRFELEKKHPLTKKKYARKYDPRPRMVEAYLFFYTQLQSFFEGTISQPPLCAEVPLSARLDESFQALKGALQVVAIDLEIGDDAQVIFETLNARGEPLLPADLLRNFIFLRAGRLGEPQEVLYEKYWKNFDDPFWRQEVQQGRLLRPRSDLFMQHFLSSRQGVDIPVKHLFVEYKFWIDRQKPFLNVEAELQTLARQGSDYRRIIAPAKDDPLRSFMEFLETFDIRTGYPLLLFFFDAELSSEEWMKIAAALESYLLRRAVCGLSTKNYNRVFLQLTKALRKEGPSAAALQKLLLEFTGESTEWPTDEAFSSAWTTKHAYQTLNNPKIVHILKRLNAVLMNSRHEDITIEGFLTVEHLMPQKWIANWPLPDGSKGMEWLDQELADKGDPRLAATRLRDSLIQTFGNLTIITQPLNSSVSNSAWSVKKPELMKSSLLPINSQLAGLEDWNEEAIQARGKGLLVQALRLWPRVA
ncbi:MAG: DUF262 domain-containing HNH endonuclease family protein [Chthoniobacter sp.]|uniref:DUF262 domain-containing protein n=1 Tax=Chthoniobacter sp. TaxID=2510640 RepID=UPI0032A23F8E